MKQRVLSAIVMIAVFFLCVFLSPITRILIFLVLGILCVREYAAKMKEKEVNATFILPAAFMASEAILVFLEAKTEAHVICFAGFVFLTLIAGTVLEKIGAKGMIATGFSLIYPSVLFAIVFMIANSKIWLNTLALGCLSVWLCDSFALFGGSLFGKHKLAPKISPHKTIEGAISGAIFSVLAGILVYFLGRWCQNVPYLGGLYTASLPLWKCMLIALIASTMGQIGDLTESLLKRMLDTKDFSNLIPGHGGAFDRADSLLFALPVTYFLLHLL